MSLYWYSIPNLNMGRVVLRATGNGGFRLGGSAKYSTKRIYLPPSTTVEQCTPDIGGLLSKYGEYLRTLARIDAITPAADPHYGELLDVVYDTAWDKYRDALARTRRTLNRLDTAVAAPAPTQGVTLVQGYQSPPVSTALERAKRQVEKLRFAEATSVITEES